MSEYDKPHSYEVYGYDTATRPEQAPDYAGFAPHPQSAPDYTVAQAQVPSGLPQSANLSLLPPTQTQYGTHDPTYYSQQQTQYPAYLESEPRQLPEVISCTPNQGPPGTKVTIHFKTIYDLDNPPVSIVVMFGHKRCDSVLSRTNGQGMLPYMYAISADTPTFSETRSPTPQAPLHLVFEGETSWQSPSLEVDGGFTFLDQYPILSPAQPSRKRKLTPEAAERRSPGKKQSYAQLPTSIASEVPSYLSGLPPSAGTLTYGRPDLSYSDQSQSRRFSVPEITYNTAPMRGQMQQSYYAPQPTLNDKLHSSQYNYYSNMPLAARSPSISTVPARSRPSHILPSPAGSSNPPLIRTSTIQQSPTSPAHPSGTTQSFNPYAMCPANTKAQLKLEGELNSMVDGWTDDEWDMKRRLVQFRRSQAGSVITASFEGVSPEERLPNSICVSCIWWAEKRECYVTSVDTIQLLESLVAVRFTVEEKNRIRRNLEGFRPATVSKTKPESEEFFKLIMGFPNPKPRNIEKDVKSASYSSTAGILQQSAAGPSGYARGSDAGLEPAPYQTHHPMNLPPTTSSSASHAYTTSMTSQSYAGGSAGLGIGPSAGPPELRLAVPGVGGNQTTAWHQQTPASHYSTSATDLSGTASAARGNSWDYGSYTAAASPATGLPHSAHTMSYQDMSAGHIPQMHPQHRQPSYGISQPPHALPEGRFLPLYDQGATSQQTSSGV
ncbi:hypothetical protein B0A48_16194 [Cryoendolithus antarcticus]|uniref:DUF7082 domain-containing protein n=1 Tax=Cryoendolithus antarcticus TaxID=1507870 RepID=A0A1V8SFL3_9PEZI|nr:hypothetical protein B0A48_16194 [Cryoendolithus antarcticus]